MGDTPPDAASAGDGAGGREREKEDEDMPVVKRRRLEISGSDGEDEQPASRSVSPWEQTPSSNQISVPVPRPPPPPSFSDKLVEVYHEPIQPSATPTYLQHRFMVSISQYTLGYAMFMSVYSWIPYPYLYMYVLRYTTWWGWFVAIATQTPPL